MENTANEQVNIPKKQKKPNKLISGIKNTYYKFYKKLLGIEYLGLIKKTIVLLLPIVLIGLAFYILLYFPVETYQNYLMNDGSEIGSVLYTLCNLTLHQFSLYLAIFLSYRVLKSKTNDTTVVVTGVIVTVIIFLLLTVEETADGSILWHNGFDSVFLTLVLAKICPDILVKFSRKKGQQKVYESDIKKLYSEIFRTIIPALVLIIIVSLINSLYSLLGCATFNDFLFYPFKILFEKCENGLLLGFIFTFFDRLTSYFGMNFGSTLLSNNYYSIVQSSSFNINVYRFLIITPSFVGFIISYIIFSKKKHDKIYGGVGFIPASINLTSVVNYSFPLMLTSYTLIPLVLSPLISLPITYYITESCALINLENEVLAATPIFLSGYVCCNSYVGILIQLMNIVISILIYVPFIRLHDYAKKRSFEEDFKNIYSTYAKEKEKNPNITLFDFDYHFGEINKKVCQKLKADISLMDDVKQELLELKNKRDEFKKDKDFIKAWEKKKSELAKKLNIKSFFQPIVSSKSVKFDEETNKVSKFEITGMECLMRWNYDGNYVIPPFIIQLAKDAGLEYELNYYLWSNMLLNVDRQRCKSFITFNISMNCLENILFVDDIIDLFEFYDVKLDKSKKKNEDEIIDEDIEMDETAEEFSEEQKFDDVYNGYIIEITEEDTFTHGEEILNKIRLLKERGFRFAIDDYGAGQTSMKYFQTNAFELVKIDGDLIKNARENKQIFDIIGNIKDLGKKSQKYSTINFKVLCEFIEDEQMAIRLKELGVDYYQGFLFGKAVTFDEIASSPMMPRGNKIKHI